MAIPRNPNMGASGKGAGDRELKLPALSEESQPRKSAPKRPKSPSAGTTGGSGSGSRNGVGNSRTGDPRASGDDGRNARNAPEEDDDWGVDPITGVRYHKLPASEYDEDGNPVLQVEIDPYDLQEDANKFLGHLRIPPNKAQRERLAKQRAAIRENNEKKYSRYQAKIRRENGEDSDN